MPTVSKVSKTTHSKATKTKRSTRANGHGKLGTYRARRHFEKTPEPKGHARARRVAEGPQFVVQKHAARRLHYDFRLELDGVLLSWSVPKGPSLSPGERRLAVRTEDHPLEYADFEGIIPQGEYGGGTVIVWDRGRWVPAEDPHEGMKKGRLTFNLEGEKLKGRFHLVRTRGMDDKHENWLLSKGRDAAASGESDIVEERPESALTGRTIEEVREHPERTWHSNRARKATTTRRTPRARTIPQNERPSTDDGDPLSLVKQLPVPFELTNLDKVLYPEQGLRKAELIAYYAAMKDWILPQLAARPLTIVRCPEGRNKPCFYQKHVKEGLPEAIKPLPLTEEDGKQALYMLIDDMVGLVALGQLGALELHTWLCHADHLERPDQLIFDLDPDEALPFERVVEAAFEMRALLRSYGLESFVKTTGGKGLHVVSPMQRRLDWDTHKAVARAIAEKMASAHPDRYLVNMRKVLRKNKVFIDFFRNGRGATAIAPYSPRARHGAPVATPLAWNELEVGILPSDFTLTAVVARMNTLRRDPWAGYKDLKQSLSAAARRKLG